MHVVLGYSDGDAVQCAAKTGLQDIPQAVEAAFATGKELAVSFDDSVVLVFPLDHRMMLASVTRDCADQRKCGFSRHIPQGFLPDPTVFPFITETGSEEDTMDADHVRARLSDLFSEGEANIGTPDNLEAMSSLRHALRLAVHHFGWNHFGTAYVLRDLAALAIATGAEDNYRSCLFLLRIFKQKLKQDEWEDTEFMSTLLGQIALGCETMGDPSLAGELKASIPG